MADPFKHIFDSEKVSPRVKRGVDYVLKNFKNNWGGEEAMNKIDALSDLGYGDRANVISEIAKANLYRHKNKMRRLAVEGDRANIEVRDRDEAAYVYDPTDESDPDYIQLDAQKNMPTTKDSVNALTGRPITVEDVIGHELTHALVRNDAADLYQIGRATPYKYDTDTEGYDKQDLTYPEFRPTEFDPALAALTRYEYQTTGKRITEPKQLQQKVDNFLKLSPEARDEFRQSLPEEVQRFYGYVDKLSSPERKDIKLWGGYNAKVMREKFPERKLKTELKHTFAPNKVSGKDRLKRFLEISKKRIPSLVRREDGTNQARG